MYRNYIRGQHESLDVDLTDAGSGAIFVKADGLEANAFYDMAIYSDSGRTTPLSVSDWENYTEDERKTASEAETGGTGETIYNQIRIINPTYQTGTIYLTFENLGTYPNGDVQGIDYIEPDDADYAYTTQIGKMTYIVFDGLTADRTVTVTDGGFDERSRFKVVNKDSTYKVIIKDGTENLPFWVVPGQSADFYNIGDSLTWCSAGRELIYDVPANTSPVLFTAINRGVITDDCLEYLLQDTVPQNLSGKVVTGDGTRVSLGTIGSSSSYMIVDFLNPTPQMYSSTGSQYIRKIWRRHDAS